MSKAKGARAVIGAGYGDEGKGLLVDALASEAATVVRCNGGAQAGHTVTTPDGRRHVFHHFGAGALAGAATHLSRFFVVNPVLWAEEAAALAALGARLDASVDPEAPVTLPFDMMLNQIAERARGHGRHGSCGLGIGETIERDAHAALRVRAGDLADRVKLAATLARVRRDWIAPRLEALGVAALSAQEREALADTAIDASWLDDAGRFAAATRLTGAPSGPLIFEGAQGLKLDQTRGAFPHVTRSNTGCRNVVALAREWGVERLELVYVSRIYRTRHGAGPLAREQTRPPVARFADATNAENSWQGRLRFAPLDLDELGLDIAADLTDARGLAEVEVALAMTCLDQAEDEVEIVRDGALTARAPDALAQEAARRVGAGRLLTSHGPTRATLDTSRRLSEIAA